MRSRLATLLSLVLLGVPFCGCGGVVDTSARPNGVVIIDVDTLRADGLSCYGNPRGTSPNIDAIAASGVRFEWAFSQAPNTPPSQASILTGLYPRRNGRVGDFDQIRADVKTFAETLQAAGFRTAAFIDGGFMSPGYGLERGFQEYRDFGGRGFAAIVPEAIDWLGRAGSSPFLLLLHTYDVHSPYAPPEPIRSRFASMVAAPSPGFEPTAERLEAIRKRRHFGEPLGLTPEDIAYARALYDGEVSFVDERVGELLSSLAKLGLDERTIVVVIADHGEEFVEHGSVLHEKLYSTVLRVPLILRIPGWRGGAVVDEAVQAVDLVPTLDQLLGVRAPDRLDGRSLVDVALGRTRSRGEAFSESPFFSKERSLVAGDWRLLLRLDRHQAELYRYREDPLEAHDLADARPEVVERLKKSLEPLENALVAAASGTRAAPGAAAPSDATLEELRALGYLR